MKETSLRAVPDYVPDRWLQDDPAQSLKLTVFDRLVEANEQSKRAVFVADDGSRIITRSYMDLTGIEVVSIDHWITQVVRSGGQWRIDHYTRMREIPTHRKDLADRPVRWHEPGLYQWDLIDATRVVTTLMAAPQDPRAAGVLFCAPMLVRSDS